MRKCHLKVLIGPPLTLKSSTAWLIGLWDMGEVPYLLVEDFDYGSLAHSAFRAL